MSVDAVRGGLACAMASLALMSCNPWPDFEAPTRLPDDPRLGQLVLEASGLRSTFISANGKGGDLWIGVVEGAGPDANFQWAEASDRLLRVDGASMALIEELALPGTPQSALSMGLSLDTDSVVVVRGGEHPSAFVLSGAAWVPVALPDAFNTQRDIVVARDGALVLQQGLDVVSLRVDREWAALALPEDALDRAVAAWGADGLAVVWTTNLGDVCAAWFSPPSLTPSRAPSCAGVSDAVELPGMSVNGQPDDFQVAVSTASGQLQLFHVAGLRFAAGDSVEAGAALLSQPGSARALLSRDSQVASQWGGYAAPDLFAVEGGRVQGQVLTAFELALSCSCSRDTDPECGCLARGLAGLVSTRSDAATAALVTLSDADGRRTVHSRRIALPFEGDPLSEAP